MNIAVITGNTDSPDTLNGFFPADICTFYKNADAVPADAQAIVDLSFTHTAEHIEALRSFLPKTVLVNSVLHTLKELNAPFTRFNGWPGFFNTHAVEVCFNEGDTKPAEEILAALKWDHVSSPDIAGFTAPRVVCMIINEAYFAFDEGVSTKDEIDTAMKLGTNYPFGPFEWGHKIGINNVYGLLKKLSALDPLYTPAPGLEKEATNNSIR